MTWLENDKNIKTNWMWILKKLVRKIWEKIKLFWIRNFPYIQPKTKNIILITAAITEIKQNNSKPIKKIKIKNQKNINSVIKNKKLKSKKSRAKRNVQS